MAAILRQNLDYAGGLIVGGSTSVFVNGAGVVRIGDAVASHGSGPHTAAVMSTGSAKVYCNGIAVCRVGDLASCGHAGTGGSPNTFAG
jgi:uncharacterized Zn-binding protein involved in type VI secretion